ncbi:dUTP diphosphatase [Planococcus faecalis]|uniref:dUTPase n=1 Tax=Planococcus faecalis TaxID=1598147 RepID=A0ABM6IQX2_9BACL|nr:dUTP diphosphatase [Planococcus faecalis]AQU78999.1 hypothetical protein AJGP001_06885 [Planococcus faecalis]OHX54737.1 hypothetical protein BB777_06190 [Planococcus faecalis]
MISLELLFEKQMKLDNYIGNNLKNKEDIFLDKSLALIVELGELANEVRSFKYWSRKTPSPKPMILEEYVDTLHFLLSIGIEVGFNDVKVCFTSPKEDNLTRLFLNANMLINIFISKPTKEVYSDIWGVMEKIRIALDLTDEEIFEGYIRKNNINYQRQKEGY